eukprot:TRINITY_DN16914_c0_g4_i1.p1 TRINITY_DN16914_c0_g4~~TRINITY_DN16914_c0_g4_i1.p1  ORF type:complete len:343 (+),score=80.26 TRINITY_DN16914_c0_g4_i1:39-1031(+)
MDKMRKVLSTEEYWSRMTEMRSGLADKMVVMYSSLVDGWVTDRALMSIPLDDHMACRGHGVFDTVTLQNGKLYRLERHLQRLVQSAEMSRVSLPFEGDKEANMAKMKEIIIETIKVAGMKTAMVRYFLSTGPGNFGFTPAGCKPAFYVVVREGSVVDELQGHAEVVVRDVPHKEPEMTGIKSNNYLQNTLVTLSARDKGGLFGLQISPDGETISESCMLGVIVVTSDNQLLTPPLAHVLPSCTVNKILSLAPKIIESGLITTAEARPVPLETVYTASELLFVGGDTHIFPVTSLDGRTIGEGKPGPVARLIQALIEDDIENGPDSMTIDF